MINTSDIKKRIATSVLLVFFMFGLVFSSLFVFVSSAQADQASGAKATALEAARAACQLAGIGTSLGANPSDVCPADTAAETDKVADKKIIKPTVGGALMLVLLNLSEFIVQRLSYEVAVWVVAAASGEQSLVEQEEAWKAFGESFGRDLIGESLGQLSENLVNDTWGVGIDLCRPPDLASFSLALGIKQAYQPKAPKCEFDDIINNWETFYANNLAGIVGLATGETSAQDVQNYMLGKLGETLKPGQNEIQATFKLGFRINHEAKVRSEKLFDEKKNKDFKSFTDVITGKVETPSSLIAKKVEKATVTKENPHSKINAAQLGAMDTEVWGQMGMMALSTFTNTLLAEALDKIYTGLFSPDDEGDPINFEGTFDSGLEGAEERYSSMLVASPFTLTDYNVLSEFIVCPVGGIINRALNNCVMDTSLMTAIARGSSGASITVKEAIEEGLINGNWPLISPEDARNQDPYCYTYGFCYGNLIKLRKARILPVGWEMAAKKNTASTPLTLNEIMEQFNSCNQDGEMDGEHPYCHLVDPEWILRYPKAQCKAFGNGEIKSNQLLAGRVTQCIDTQSCIGENNNGECTDGYGRCVKEKNVWRFRGKECPAQYATCLALENTTDNSKKNYLLNTVDFSVCGQSSAGCRWYRTNKNIDYKETADDTSDDVYEWMPTYDSYESENRGNDYKWQEGGGGTIPRDTFVYDTVLGPQVESEYYTYEDRVYFNRQIEKCSEEGAGCAELISQQGIVLNAVNNGSFEVDEDENGVPDHWIGGIAPGTIDNNISYRGGNSMKFTGAGEAAQYVPVIPNQFYTYSFYAHTTAPKTVTSSIMFYDDKGLGLDPSGLSFGGDCVPSALFDGYVILKSLEQDVWTKVSCSFTTVEDSSLVLLHVNGTSLKIDAVQLELGENATDFVSRYSSSSDKEYIKVAPDYLNCRGLSTDPKECANYATMCSAQQVGCNLYTPYDGDPAVPAIVSALDYCPNECVGYAAFKQEDTRYDKGNDEGDVNGFLYFIPEKSVACSEQYVGCDGFTSLEAADAGGEGSEFYTYLRACLTDDMATGAANKTSSTYFTWEGSDTEGYQLKTWQLLESNLNEAPCTLFNVSGIDEVVCSETIAHVAAQEADESCNEHDDIFDEPECREFFDSEGDTHYRMFSETVTVSNQCAHYRKNESTQTDCTATHGYWAEQGFCRYFGLPQESLMCPSGQDGCRAYTGGGSRNSVTIFEENFEGGNYNSVTPWKSVGAPDMLLSNESVATDGHSLRVSAPASINGIRVFHAYRNAINPNVICDEDDPTWVEDKKVCEKDADGDGTIDCEIKDGENSCGVLTDKLVNGKTYMLQFWAKGDGELFSGFEFEGGLGDEKDFVNPVNSATAVVDFESIQLSGSWEVYNLGPIDTSLSAFNDFDKDTVLFFATGNGETFYIDNISLKQVDDNIAIIKDSWVTPVSCDTAPNGSNSPQYYLGCEGYSDKDGQDVSLYQFSNLCSEKVVGCEGYYKTQNSESPYKQLQNARCQYDTNNNPLDDESVSVITDCEVDGKTYCTIPLKQSFCTFSTDELIPDPLPIDGNFKIVFGPETVVTNADEPVYLINNGDHSCSSEFAGCKEYGKPKFNRDHSIVESFESVYLINKPVDYEKILCNNAELFCEEYNHKSEGIFYFKEPLDKKCEYKAGITIGNQEYKGWFKLGSSEPCYGEDTNDNGNIESTEAYVLNGNYFGIWKNGDAEDYDGWVGQCKISYDMCTEFIDVVDTEGGLVPDGAAYYFINDELLDDEVLSSTQRCEGQVSQKEGCAIFKNTTESELKYNASATYVLSVHADLLLNSSVNSAVDPIDCTLDNEFEVTDAALAEINRGRNSASVNPLNLCESRCWYTQQQDPNNPDDDLASGDYLETSMTTPAGIPGAVNWHERSCIVDSDCPVLESKFGKEMKGECRSVSEVWALNNDSNEIIKVNRDRSCAAWLACQSSKTGWNEEAGRYDVICDSINLCTEGKNIGAQSACTQWDPRDPLIFTEKRYSARNVNWSGSDYAGFSIPDQLPVELYDQINLNPDKRCQTAVDNPVTVLDENDNKVFVECNADDDCSSGTCEAVEDKNFHLVYNAGPCDSSKPDVSHPDAVGYAGACKVGHCSNSGNNCAKDSDCEDAEDLCVIGYCMASADHGGADTEGGCVTNSDCSTAGRWSIPGDEGSTNINTPVCEYNKCVSNLGSACISNDSCNAGYSCASTSTTSEGICINNSCITSIRDDDQNGLSDQIKVTINASEKISKVEFAEPKSCRAHPENDSPQPNKVVKLWVLNQNNTNATGEEPTKNAARPFIYSGTYNNSNVCSLVDGELTDDCMCSYDKMTGIGALNTYYYPLNTPTTKQINKVCVGGERSGMSCVDDPALCVADGGVCKKINRKETFYGWDGLCLERDTSITLFGVPGEEGTKGACLTWMPIDQLSGSTDLFAKYTSAGFKPEDINYCADIALFYDVKTSPKMCAEDSVSYCDDEWSKSALEDDDDYQGANCDHGYFAVMSQGCGEGSPDGCTSGGDDYPYYCVPFGSYKTETDGGGDKGDPCLPPFNSNNPSAPGANFTKSANDNTRIFFPNEKSDYQKAKTFFNDCEVKGVPQDKAVLFTDGDDGDAPGHYDSYVACLSTVEVSSSNLTNDHVYNYAWTNRMWESGTKKFGGVIQYEYDTDIVPFGVARDVADVVQLNSLSDMYPNKAVMCLSPITNAAVLPPPGVDACEGLVVEGEAAAEWELSSMNERHKLDVDGADAKPYYNVAIIQPPEGITELQYVQELEGGRLAGAIAAFTGLSFLTYGVGGLIATVPTPAKSNFWCQENKECNWDNRVSAGDGGRPVECVGDKICRNMTGSLHPGASCTVKAEDWCGLGEGDYEVSCSNSSQCMDAYFPGEEHFHSLTNCKKEEGENTGLCTVPCEWQDKNGADPGLGNTPTCRGGTMNNALCYQGAEVCFPNRCSHAQAIFGWGGCVSELTKPEITYFEGGTIENAIPSGISRLNDLFAQSFSLNTFDDELFKNSSMNDHVKWKAKTILASFLKNDKNWPAYSGAGALNAQGWEGAYINTPSSHDWSWDVRVVGDGSEDGTPTAPIIRSLGLFLGDQAREGADNTISVAGQSGGIVNGGAFKRVDVSFYTEANKNQMPIRRVVVDWGDGENSNLDWPTDSQTPPNAIDVNDNFYKNHRGLDLAGNPICGGINMDFAKTEEACSNSYMKFTHDYICTPEIQHGLPTCNEENGRLTNSPCTGEVAGGSGACVYQPRAHLLDNWGWCTGFCNGSSKDGTDGCFIEGDECDIRNCPDDGSTNGNCSASGGVEGDERVINPWVNFDGFVILTP